MRADRQVIRYGDFDEVPPIGFDQRARELAINNETILLYSIGSDSCIADIEIVATGDTSVRHSSAKFGSIIDSRALRC